MIYLIGWGDGELRLCLVKDGEKSEMLIKWGEYSGSWGDINI